MSGHQTSAVNVNLWPVDFFSLDFTFKFVIFLFQCQFFVHEAQSSFVTFPVSAQVHRRNVIEASTLLRTRRQIKQAPSYTLSNNDDAISSK